MNFGGFRRTPFPFSPLSAGAKEQFAATLRFAAAEILAEPFGGTLPVFFDDSFVNSDQDRIKGLSRALDRAQHHGLRSCS